MPLFIPFLFGGAALASSAWGLKTGANGVSNLKKARERGKAAEERHRHAAERLEAAGRGTNRRAGRYAKFQAQVLTSTVRRFLDFLEQLKRKGKLREVEALAEISLTPQLLEQSRASVMEAESFLKAGASAVAAGVAASQGAVALAGLVGVASTGTAIGSLSGAAATNAMFAWFGGGSLAAGGFGIAGGTLVLGGITAAPALAFAGFALASQGERALTQAEQFSAKVDKAVAELETRRKFLGKVNRRIKELESLLSALDARARMALDELHAETFEVIREQDLRRFQTAYQLMVALGEVLRTPVLDAQGALDETFPGMKARFVKLTEAQA